MPYKINIPPFAGNLITSLQTRGFPAYIVGGCVRDSLMSAAPHDYDITTAASPAQVHSVLSDYKIFDTGIKHGTVTVLSDGNPIEITTFRSDGEYKDFRRPEKVFFSSDIRDDLSRRDFTVNAMAYSDSDGLIDLFGGISDLSRKIIRCVGDPDARFNEDALRIFRALRFASVLGFSIEECTANSILRNAGLIKNIAAERMTSEFLKLLPGQNVCKILLEFKPVISIFIPQFSEVSASDILKLCSLKKSAAIRLAALLCSLPGDSRADAAAHALSNMRLDNLTRKNVLALSSSCGNLNISPLEIIKSHGIDFFDSIIHINRVMFPHNSELWDKLYSDGQDICRHRCTSLKELTINGRDLIACGFLPCSVGSALDELLTLVMRGKLPNDRHELLCAAREMLNRQNL